MFMPQLSKEIKEVLRMLKLILAERPELEREITCDMASWLEMLKRALENAPHGKDEPERCDSRIVTFCYNHSKIGAGAYAEREGDTRGFLGRYKSLALKSS